MSDQPDDPVAMNYSQRLAYMPDGTTRPITNLFGADGQEIEGDNRDHKAVSAVVKLAEDSWLTVDLTKYHRPTYH